MPASVYANTRLFRKAWLSGSTSNAYLCVLQRPGVGKGKQLDLYKQNKKLSTCIVAGSVWLTPKNPPAAAVSDLRNRDVSRNWD